jgi:Cysteine-rich secretory protein family
MRRFVRSLLLLCLVIGLSDAACASEVTADAVIREMNLARQNPAAYATFLEDLRPHYNGRVFVLPGQTRIYTHEGLGAVDDAIHFLRSTSPLRPLALSTGMCRGAADHCAEQAGGAIGHGNPAGRMNRYGTWAAAWGENISYGRRSARDIVMALIIDDGLPARKHRANIFAAKFNYAGAAYGPHARYGSVCSIDFAGAYFERDGQTAGNSLVAKNY